MDKELDLEISRIVNAPAEVVWRAYTEPALLEQFWCPKPWRTTDVVIDAKPGGRFAWQMYGPEGEHMEGEGTYLVVEHARKLVFTDALTEGFRPSGKPFLTAILTLTPQGDMTELHCRVLHFDAATRENHEHRGFHQGWGKVLEQLDELVQSIK